MKQLMRSLRILLVLFVFLSFLMLIGIVYQQNKSQALLLQSSNENKQALHSRYAAAGTIYSQDMVKLAYSENADRHYADNSDLARSCIQIVGDYTHNIGNTIEGAYQDRLIGTGRSWYKQILLDFTGKGSTGDDIVLTLNSELNLKAQELLDGYAGSIVMLNYQTGEILCAVSTPNTTPENVITWQDIPESALFNRSFNSRYAPGSTFKIITGTAWSESDLYDPNYVMYCRGQEPLLGPGSVVENRGEDSHGELNMMTAYAVSCNHFFGDVGIKAGFDLMNKTAEQFAFNQDLSIGKLIAQTGTYKALNQDNYLLSWQAIGQPIDTNELTVSTLHLAMISGGIANQGEIMQPYLIDSFIDPLGHVYDQTQPQVFSKVDDKADLAAVKNDLIYTVTNGKSASAYLDGFIVGGKTGTAESVNENGELESNSLYTGFLDDPACPIAIGIVMEGGFYDTPSIAGAMLYKAIEILR